LPTFALQSILALDSASALIFVTSVPAPLSKNALFLPVGSASTVGNSRRILFRSLESIDMEGGLAGGLIRIELIIPGLDNDNRLSGSALQKFGLDPVVFLYRYLSRGEPSV
jgi:hypothetical protein